MVSLIYGMPSWIPGGCTCMPDPVGVPDTQAIAPAVGLANMQYMGRIKLPNLEYLNVPIELDHWANWFFHIFMDTNKSVPRRSGPSTATPGAPWRRAAGADSAGSSLR